jgi:hypothetical protein
LLFAHTFLLYTCWVSLVRIPAKSDVPKRFVILLLFSARWGYAPLLFLVSVQCRCHPFLPVQSCDGPHFVPGLYNLSV